MLYLIRSKAFSNAFRKTDCYYDHSFLPSVIPSINAELFTEKELEELKDKLPNDAEVIPLAEEMLKKIKASIPCYISRAEKDLEAKERELEAIERKIKEYEEKMILVQDALLEQQPE